MPSRVRFRSAGEATSGRGNILIWEQRLRASQALIMVARVKISRSSIGLLAPGTFVAAMTTLGTGCNGSTEGRGWLLADNSGPHPATSLSLAQPTAPYFWSLLPFVLPSLVRRNLRVRTQWPRPVDDAIGRV